MNIKTVSLLSAAIMAVGCTTSAHAEQAPRTFFETKVAVGAGYVDPNLGIDLASGKPTTISSFSYNNEHWKVGVEEIKVQGGTTSDATSPANERHAQVLYHNSVDTLYGEFKYQGAVMYRAMNKDTTKDDYWQVSLRAGRPFRVGTWTIEPYIRSELMIPVKYNNQLHMEAVGLDVMKEFPDDTVLCLRVEYVQDINSTTATAHRRFMQGELCAEKRVWENLTLSARFIYVQYRPQDSDYVPTWARDGKVMLLRPRTSSSIDPTENTIVAQAGLALKFYRLPFMQ